MPMPLTAEDFKDRMRTLDARIQKWIDLENRFGALFGESSAGAEARVQRELVMDGDLRETPAVHRLTMARQLVLGLDDFELIDRDATSLAVGLRAIAAQIGVPYLELSMAERSCIQNPDTTRSDLADWVGWCREHARAADAGAGRDAEAQGGKEGGVRAKQVQRELRAALREKMAQETLTEVLRCYGWTCMPPAQKRKGGGG
ncbi:MAG: hypothetical protein ACRERC_20040 [Candidatus Binatia bacterium]